MATLQEQVDELRKQLVNVQASVALRALKSEVITMNTVNGQKMEDIINNLNVLEYCLKELQNALIEARKQLRTHSH